MALGASTRHLVLQLGRHGVVLGVIGTCLGVAVAVADREPCVHCFPVGANLDPRILTGASLALFSDCSNGDSRAGVGAPGASTR